MYDITGSEFMMPFFPKFSVVIPVYNKEKTLKSMLRSVQAQSYRSFEVIVVNDGSTDDSASEISEVPVDNLLVITKENNGVSSARNAGIGNAKGEYVAFLDADDIWYPWHLEELSKLIDAFPNLAIYSNAHEIRRAGKTFVPKRWGGAEFFGAVEDVYEAFSLSLGLVNSSTACVRRDVLLNIGGFPEGARSGEDVYVWLRSSEFGGLAYNARISAVYNQEAENRSDLAYDQQVPYYITYLDRRIFAAKTDFTLSSQAKKFLTRAVIFTAAGLKLRHGRNALESMRTLSIYQSLHVKMLLTVIALIPDWVLELLKRARHGPAKAD